MTSHPVSSPRWPLSALVLVGGLVLVFGSSMFASGGDLEERVTNGSYGAGMGIFALAVIIEASRGSRSAWVALWYLPVFLTMHVIWLDVWVPDLPLAVLSVAALLALRAQRSESERESPDGAASPGRVAATRV